MKLSVVGTGALVLVGGVVMACAQSALAAGMVCDVRAYGAKGDGVTKDTVAIQKAIDACAWKDVAMVGKGMLPESNVVRLEGGTFLSAPIELKSGITLEIAKGATLLASPDHADFKPQMVFKLPGVQPFVSAVHATHVTVTGGGVLDGNGQSWWEMIRGKKDGGVLGNANPRPMGLVFDHSQHIRVENITVQNSGFWQIVPYYSDDIVIRNSRVLAPRHAPNTDGIDPFSSSNIVIEHMYEDVDDDDVAIKSGPIDSPGPDAPSKNITISDCEIRHGHGISIGSEIAGGAQNVLVERVHFVGTDNGVRVKANRDRGSDVSGIIFRDITMEDVKNTLIISEYYPKALPEGTVESAPIGRLTPFFHDITIENLKSVGSEWAGVVIGLPESPVKNLVMKNVEIEAKKGLQIAYAVVTASNVKVTASVGEGITVTPTAQVTMTK